MQHGIIVQKYGLGIYCIYIILINFIYLCIDILFKQLTFQGIELYK